MKSLDSLLVVIHHNPEQMDSAGRYPRSIFWSNGHAHGAYMARTIDETLGRETVWESLKSPFTFLANFAEAVRQRSGASLFSVDALAVLYELEQRYGNP